MSNIISVADVIKCGACDARLQQMFEFLERMNIDKDSTIDIDEMIALYNANGMRHFAYWLNSLRPTLLGFTDVKKVVYEVNSTEYQTIEQARTASQAAQEARRQYHVECAPVAFSESIDEGHTWVVVDIDNFVIPENTAEYHFHVFDHETGVHTEAYSVEEAKSQRDAYAAKCLAHDSYYWLIKQKTYFHEHETACLVEVVT